jgi:hypothetical protein
VGVVRRLAGVFLFLALLMAVWGVAAAFASFPGQDGVVAYSSAFGGSPSSGTHIWAVDPASGEQLQLTSGPFEDIHPSFSPSGEALVFARYRLHDGFYENERDTSLPPEIYLMNLDGSSLSLMTTGAEPAFGPAGREIVFVRNGSIYILSTSAGAKPELIAHGPGNSAPSWSVTGQIAFEHSRPVLKRYEGYEGLSFRTVLNQLDITLPAYHRVQTLFTYEELMSREDVELQEEGKEVDLFPDWSPDGNRILLSLCRAEAGLEGVIPTNPQLVIHPGCEPDVWLPDAHGRIGLRSILTNPDASTCPILVPFEPVALSYQPLGIGSSRVPVKPCLILGGPIAFSPAEPALGSRTCYTLHHRRHCRVYRSSHVVGRISY